MYLWSTSILVTAGANHGKMQNQIFITPGSSFDEALTLGQNLSGEIQQCSLVGYVPGIVGSGIIGVKLNLVYGIFAYKYPLLYSPVTTANAGIGIRKVITDWSRRIDPNVGTIYKPPLNIGPLPAQPNDPTDTGRAAIMAAIPGLGSSDLFAEVVATEVFEGEISKEDITIILFQNLNNTPIGTEL